MILISEPIVRQLNENTYQATCGLRDMTTEVHAQGPYRETPYLALKALIEWIQKLAVIGPPRRRKPHLTLVTEEP